MRRMSREDNDSTNPELDELADHAAEAVTPAVESVPSLLQPQTPILQKTNSLDY